MQLIEILFHSLLSLQNSIRNEIAKCDDAYQLFPALVFGLFFLVFGFACNLVLVSWTEWITWNYFGWINYHYYDHYYSCGVWRVRCWRWSEPSRRRRCNNVLVTITNINTRKKEIITIITLIIINPLRSHSWRNTPTHSVFNYLILV